MRVAIVMFALGIWACQQLPSLPSIAWLGACSCGLTVAGTAAFLRSRRRRGGGGCVALGLLALAAGFLWASWRAEWRLADELPSDREGRDVVVTGVVADLPQRLERGVRFVFNVDEAEGTTPRRILVSWYGGQGGDGPAPAVRAGERWRFAVRLKRPHGFANPHGFDYEAWLLERNLRATGYVRASPAPLRLAALVPEPMLLVHRARDGIRARFEAALAGGAYTGVLTALAVGDQRAIPREQWTVFRNTGVSHLVSISGLHVSLVALLGGAVAGRLWRRVPRLMLHWPARKAAALGGLACAAGYALLAGLGIPTQRALVMLAVVALALLAGREAAGSRVMALALFAVLVVDPWAVLSAGFWLSFGAVGVILFLLAGRPAPRSGWREAVRVQLGITLATVPALLALFNAFSLVSPLANALAIPVVSFLVTPLTLLAVVLPFGWLLELAHWLTWAMMQGLERLAALPVALWQQAVPPAALTAAGVAGAAWLLLPRGTPARHAGLFAMLPMLTWTPPRPAPGEFAATILEVGHGLAVHVQTAGHDLVYDTGPAYGGDSDAGERVLLPYLTASGLRRLDRLVLSHDDGDHSGGAASLLVGMPMDAVVAGPGVRQRWRGRSDPRVLACEAGLRWERDGVSFEVLHPSPHEPPLRRDNDASCVLRVSAPGGSLLLAGDIEKEGERRLVARHGTALASSVVVVPHHGSRSSSTPALIEATAPVAAVFSVGRLNPFRHPHPAVWARWGAAGARNWRTDSQGAVLVTVGKEVRVDAQRLREPRYWR